MIHSFLRTLLAGGVIFMGLSTSVWALMWQDYDGWPLDYLNEPYRSGDSTYDLSYTGWFNILNDGYDPTMHVVTHARVGFSFADDGSDVGEWVDISLDSTKIWNNLEVDGSHPQPNFDWHWQSISGNIDLMGSLQDGRLRYTVRLQQRRSDYDYGREDVWLKEAHLKAYGHQVPDSGDTILLLGLGLIGITFAAKRLKKSDRRLSFQ